MTARADGGALTAIVDLVGAPGELAPHLGGALDLIAGEAGARVAAAYLGDPAAGGLELRGVGGPGPRAATPARTIRPGIAPRVCAALTSGRDAVVDELADELAALGLAGGRLIATRTGGRTVAALGLAPSPAESVADPRLRAAVQVLGLGLRNEQLAAGIRDRVRELDRQAQQLGALTEVARRVAGSLEPADAHRVVVAQARALVRADGATLFLADRASGLEAVAVDGTGLSDPSQDEEVARLHARGGARRSGRMAAAALPRAEGGGGPASGVIAVSRARGAPFDDDDLERLRGLAGQAAVALANARLLDDLRREQETRRSLAAALVQAQEQERRRIAEDLHDGPVQELVGVGLLLDALSAQLAPGAADDVDRAAAAAREAVRGLRRAIADLHPLVLEQLGFAAAVGSLLERLEWAGVEVNLDVASADRLSETQRAVAFRIVQEAVANVARHADARRVSVRAHARDDGVVIEIADDGRGFDPGAPRIGAAAGHLGLATAEERARLAGGELAIRSARGQGTVVVVTLPAVAGGGAQPGRGESSASAAASASSSAKRSSTTT